VKKVLALINEIQIQDSCSSDEESTVVPPTKNAMICKLAQIPPEIWMTLPLEAKKWLLNERKSQQHENDKMKKSLALSKSTAVLMTRKLEILYAKSICKSEKCSERRGCNQGEYRTDL
jgi:hypothetical protein